MGRVFAVRPKRIKRTNGQVLTPEMEITVTIQQYTSDTFIMGRRRYKMGSNMSNLAFSNGEMELISLFNFRWVQK